MIGVSYTHIHTHTHTHTHKHTYTHTHTYTYTGTYTYTYTYIHTYSQDYHKWLVSILPQWQLLSTSQARGGRCSVCPKGVGDEHGQGASGRFMRGCRLYGMG